MNEYRILRGIFSCILLLALVSSSTLSAQSSERGDWPNYGNDLGGMRYSTLTQINRDTVTKLKVAWVFHTGNISNGSDGYKRSGFETTPILVTLGGTITTAGGLVVIAGTADSRIRAFDALTGTLLWEAQLPVSGSATPITYQSGGKQYLVIAAGGHQGISEEQLADSLVAFSLP